MKPKYRKLLILSGCILLVLDLTLTVVFDWTVRTHTEQLADSFPKSIAVAFFTDFGPFDGVDSSTRDTLERALAGYKKKEYVGIICVGGFRGSSDKRGSLLMRKYLLSRGVKERDAFADAISFDTETNLRNAADAAKNYGIKHLTLISNPYHLARILTLVNNSQEFEDLYISVSPSTYTSFSLTSGIKNWWMIHSEFIAWAGWFLVPKDTYRYLIEWYRVGGVTD